MFKINKVISTMAAIFTCITCGVAFRDAEVQRQHYKSDWHRYNLKRKVAGFEAVTAQNFQQLVLDQRAIQEQKNQPKTMHCQLCHKTFNGENSYQNHLASKKHKEKEEQSESEIPEEEVQVPDIAKSVPIEIKDEVEDDESMETDSEIEEISDDEWNEDDENNPINRNGCLFCSHVSHNMTANLKHMTEKHSFFVPDIEYCIDLKGMMLYLGAKIHQGFICLWCGETGKTFQTAQAVQKHMVDKGHCKINPDGDALAEFSDYYDYSSSYPDAVDHDADDEVDIPVLDDSDFQLTLPSGSTIGHRSLMRYYKQSLDPKKGMIVQRKIQQVLSSYRMQGYTPLQKEQARRKARDVQFMRRAQQKFYSQVGCKANKLQKHFRQQVDY